MYFAAFHLNFYNCNNLTRQQMHFGKWDLFTTLPYSTHYC